MDPKLPDRLNRATFDRVLQRAAELQAASKDIGEGLSEEDILALGNEVGIPVQHLRQALLEERTRVTSPAPHGPLDRWIAPAEFVAQRVVQGSPEAVGAAVTKWMERQEHFVVQRATAGRITFEPLETLAGAMRRFAAVFDPTRGKPYLDKAELVTAVITPLEAGFCHITLAASLRVSRKRHVLGGSVAAFGGVAAGAAVSLMGASLLIAAIPLIPFGAIGWAVTESYQNHANRAPLGLERALDELERRPPLPGDRAGPSVVLARGVGQVVRDIRQEVRKALDE